MSNSLIVVLAIAAAVAVGIYLYRSKSAGQRAFDEVAMPEPLKIDETPDTPRAFGYKMVWLAIRTDDPSEVVNALDLEGTETANWRTGVGAAYEASPEDHHVFVAPPIEGWTLVVGGLPDSGDANTPDRASALLKHLGTEFSEVQYFGTHRVVEWHAWARVLGGTISRAYAYIGEQGHKIWDTGAPTDQEEALGFNFFDPASPEAPSDDYWERTDLEYPSEEHVIRLAAEWSIDPTQLEELQLPPSVGVVGRIPKKWW